MGVYYRGVRKPIKNVQGFRVASTKFYGKAPSFFASGGNWERTWNAFLTVTDRIYEEIKNDYDYVVSSWEDGAFVLLKSNSGLISDMTIDRYIVGNLRNVSTGKRAKWVIDFKEGYDPETQNVKEVNEVAWS